jgi:flagellar hook protein FlgE
MLESIYVGMTGLDSYAKGLNVISNNVANLNTIGFKSSQLQFEDLYQRGDWGAGHARQPLGAGVTTGSTVLNFQQGEARSTGGELDVLVQGPGLFVLRKDGDVTYTRAGQFSLDAQGVLVDASSGARVAGLDAAGHLTDLSVAGLRASAARATSRVRFTGNLSTADTQHVVTGVTVIDPLGQAASWTLTFDNTNTVTPGSWRVTVTGTDGSQLGVGELRFTNGRPSGGFDTVMVFVNSAGRQQVVELSFGQDVTSSPAGANSTLALSTQDGYAAGTLRRATLDEDGFLVLTYTNDQTDRAGQLALAWFASPDLLEPVGNNQFAARIDTRPVLGVANQAEFGPVVAGQLESSNVDLSQQFSDMIITQRGYQASSQVVTTANEMIQQLLDMRGKR